MGRPELSSWLERVTGAGRVVSMEPMGGSTSASIFRARFDDGHPDLVAKVYDKPTLAAEAADFVRREAAALVVAEAVALPTPLLVVADPTGAEIGAPVVAMTAIAGMPRARAEPDPDLWVDGLAGALGVIDDAPVSADGLDRYEAWDGDPVETPAWSTDPGPWREMSAVLQTDLPSAPWRFIHRDLHMLNVLWVGDRVSGVVDWPNACVGPIEADIARSRVNIAMVSDPAHPLALADRFTERCGQPYDRHWDLTVAAGFLRNDGDAVLRANEFGAGVTRPGILAVLEAVVRSALTP